MNPKTRSATAAGALVLALGAPLLLISREPPVPAASHPEPPAASSPLAVHRGQPATVDPQEIAALFGFTARRIPRPAAHPGEPPPQVSPSAPPAPASNPAPPPLRYVGWVRQGQAGRAYLFADPLTGRIFRLFPGRHSGRWTLIEQTANRFVLSDGSSLYAVEGR